MKKIVFTLILLCLFITPVRAFELALTGSDTIEKTEVYTVDIRSLGEYSGFYGMTAKLEYDKEKLELLEITGDNGFTLSYSNKTDKIVLYSPKGISEKGTIISLRFRNIKLKEAEESTITISGITATDSNKDVKVDNIVKKIKAKNDGVQSNTNVSGITINGKELDTSNGDISYEIVVSNDTEKIDIVATTDNKTAQIIGNGSYDLEEGTNEIKITVKDGEDDKTYTINVNRENSKSTIDDKDLFIGSKKNKWNNLYFIPIGVILLMIIIILVIKRKGVK